MWKTHTQAGLGGLLETVVWFSLFEYPPTVFEVWRFSFGNIGYEAVAQGVEELVVRGVLVTQHGRYALRGEERLFEERELRYRDALDKLHKAQRAVGWLRQLRDVRAVFACNTLGLLHTRPESDIDVFVIAKGGSLWRVRAMSVTPFAVLGKRGKGAADALCFSFFLSDAGLDVSRFSLPDGDPYLAFWIATLLPLYDPDGLGGRVIAESGVTQVFPQLLNGAGNGEIWGGRALGERRRGWLGLPEVLEVPLERAQRLRFPRAITERMNQGTDVVVTSEALKFHTEDGRLGYRQRFLEKLRRFV